MPDIGLMSDDKLGAIRRLLTYGLGDEDWQRMAGDLLAEVDRLRAAADEPIVLRTVVEGGGGGMDVASEFLATFTSEWERNRYALLVPIQMDKLVAYVDEMPWLDGAAATELIARVANSDRRSFGFAESVLNGWQANGGIDNGRQQGAHHGRPDATVRGTGANKVSQDVADLIDVQKRQHGDRARDA